MQIIIQRQMEAVLGVVHKPSNSYRSFYDDIYELNVQDSKKLVLNTFRIFDLCIIVHAVDYPGGWEGDEARRNPYRNFPEEGANQH